jgi:hypothetical protein
MIILSFFRIAGLKKDGNGAKVEETNRNQTQGKRTRAERNEARRGQLPP